MRNVLIAVAVVLLGVTLVVYLKGDGLPRRVPVAGQVLIDGQPVSSGFIQFVPAGARPAQGRLDAEGRFQLTTFTPADGAVLGEHKVVVVAREPMGHTAIKWLVPQKYSDPSTSDKKVQVSAPVADLRIELSWSGGQPVIERSEMAGDYDVGAAVD